jgi:hypothetical protein
MREEMSEAGRAFSGVSAAPAGGGALDAAAVRKGRNSSIGMGKMVVELFSAAISVTVCK